MSRFVYVCNPARGLLSDHKRNMDDQLGLLGIHRNLIVLGVYLEP